MISHPLIFFLFIFFKYSPMFSVLVRELSLLRFSSESSISPNFFQWEFCPLFGFPFEKFLIFFLLDMRFLGFILSDLGILLNLLSL